MKLKLGVELAGIKMKNPVMTASGTFGWGREYAELVDLGKLGAIVVKGVTIEERQGNKPPRIWETPAGMLNSIGLQNKGVGHFIEEDLPFLGQYDVPVIVNVAGSSVDDYSAVCERLEQAQGVAGLELNISCPNVKSGGLEFGRDAEAAAELVKRVRANTAKPLIVKLSPNVADIAEIAKAVEAAGADGLSLINTVLGMAIDPETWHPRLANVVGGLSGPAIRPIAVRMVWEAARAVKIPVVGMGGILTARDAVEFFLAGAHAVAVGTANFLNPRAALDVLDGIEEYLERKRLTGIAEIVGKVELT